MNDKYEITDIVHPQFPWLHRIRALKDIREDVHEGDLGGFVDNEENLSQVGSCWVYDDALVFEDAEVSQESTLHDCAFAHGNSTIMGTAEMRGNAIADNEAVINAGKVLDCAVIAGGGAVMAQKGCPYTPVIKDNAAIYGIVSGNVEISGHSYVGENQTIRNPEQEKLYLHAPTFTGPVMSERATKSKKHTEPER